MGEDDKKINEDEEWKSDWKFLVIVMEEWMNRSEDSRVNDERWSLKSDWETLVIVVEGLMNWIKKSEDERVNEKFRYWEVVEQSIKMIKKKVKMKNEKISEKLKL